MFLSFKKIAGSGGLLIALSFAACDKEPQYNSPQKLLSQAAWQISTDSLVTFNANPALPADTEDLQSNVPPCVADNLIFFDADGVYRQEEGPQKCNDSAQQNTTLGRWEYDAAKKKLILDGAGRLEWEVLQLNNEVLKLLLQTTFFNTTDTIRRAQTRVYIHPGF